MSEPFDTARGRLPAAEIFPPVDYRHRLRLARGEPADFFGPWTNADGVLSERARWLREAPERHALALPEAIPLLEELVEWVRDWGIIPPEIRLDPAAPWLPLGTMLEPDLVVLRPADSQPRMVAACVCFPSSWAPERKLGLGLPSIHEVVPALNEELGASIGGFLARLRPGVAWLRANWGLSASPERNQHPLRGLPPLSPTTDLQHVQVRIEHQALVALPRTGGILFGIRIDQQPLRQFAEQPELAQALARALRSMPEAMARYKGLAAARERIADYLSAPPPGAGM